MAGVKGVKFLDVVGGLRGQMLGAAAGSLWPRQVPYNIERHDKSAV